MSRCQAKGYAGMNPKRVEYSVTKQVQPSVKIKFYFVIAAVLVVLVGLSLLGKIGLDTLSAMRAYVGGEGLWSKGQKEASYDLARYVITGDESDFQGFQENLRVPLSIRRARLQLESPDPDIDEIRRGFTGGGIHINDVRPMVWLFSRFRRVEYIERALDIWTAGDELVLELEALGAQIHTRIQAGGVAAEEIGSMLGSINPIHDRLDRLEKDFSATLGEAARWARGLLILVMTAFTVIGAVICVMGLLLVTRMSANLQEQSLELAKQNRQKTGQTALHERMQGVQQLDGLLDNVLAFVAEFVYADIGAVYLVGDTETLRLSNRYAFTERDLVANEIRLGEGIVGQAAKQKKSKLLMGIPDDYAVVRSAIGETAPRCIFVLPLLYEGELKAVIELGSVSEFADEDLRFLESVADSIAVVVHGIQSHQRVQELLERSQQQAEELEVQQEELRKTNEGLAESHNLLKEQQRTLEETNASLEEKTLDLEASKSRVEKANEDLQAAQQLIVAKARNLESTSKYKSEFLANMSHELRTPLNSIMLLSNLLSQNREGNLVAKQVEFARTIRASGEDLLGLINEVLDLSKIEAGKMELLVEDVDLRAWVSVVKRSVTESANDKGLDFSVHVAKNAPTHIRTDEQRLGQVVKNLLSNAIKFTEKGSVRLTVERPDSGEPVYLAHELPPGPSVAIIVSDTGIGIPVDERELVFEAFKQVDASTSREYGGTGLGLSISRELAKLLGGQLLLESRVGEGSRFTVVLPDDAPDSNKPETTVVEDSVQDTDVLPDESEVKGETSAPEVERPLPTEREASSPLSQVQDDRKDLKPGDRSLLIIEDDPGFARTLLELAREREFKGLIAEDGRTGLQLAEYYEPTAVLLDIGLPDVDGMTIVERMKENLRTRHIPVHVISADRRKFEALKRGALGYLEKPVKAEQLDAAFEKIEELVSKPVRDLLIAVGDGSSREHIAGLIGEKDVRITAVATGEDALEQLGSKTFDCMVLDAGLPETGGVELLKQIRTGFNQIPIVVFSAEDLSSDERLTLDRYADRIVFNDAHYSERLLDETALFLHRVEKNLPEEKRRMIRTLHDSGAIFRNKKVLIVDDDMRNVFALCSILEERNVNTVVARHGREALDRLDEHPDADLVLMDIMMPEMDGYEAMRHIRTLPQFIKLPIIALTAKAMRGDRAACIDAGASDYLAKPVDTERLLSMLRVWLYK